VDQYFVCLDSSFSIGRKILVRPTPILHAPLGYKIVFPIFAVWIAGEYVYNNYYLVRSTSIFIEINYFVSGSFAEEEGTPLKK